MCNCLVNRPAASLIGLRLSQVLSLKQAGNLLALEAYPEVMEVGTI
ncbi:MAG: hypothetical protein WCA35_28840 [Kovacikia sp.]